jgi:hypothetical protein
MAKKLYAVTNIKGGDVEVKAGDPVDPEKFSKAELKALYDNGAVEVREEADTDAPVEEAPAGPDTTVENPKAATDENAQE